MAAGSEAVCCMQLTLNEEGSWLGGRQALLVEAAEARVAMPLWPRLLTGASLSQCLWGKLPNWRFEPTVLLDRRAPQPDTCSVFKSKL